MEELQGLPSDLANDGKNIIKTSEKASENAEKSTDFVEIELSKVEISDLLMGEVSKEHLKQKDEDNDEVRLSQEEVDSLLNEEIEEGGAGENMENPDDISQFVVEIADLGDVGFEEDKNVEETLDFEAEMNDAENMDDERCRDYIEGQKNENTVKKTIQVMNKFREYLHVVKEDRPVVDIPPLKLNKLIGLFLIDLVKSDGSDMEPDTVTSYHRGLDRYLHDNNYPERILTSDLFESSRVILGAKRKELKSKGLGNRPNRAESLTDTMIEKLWTTGELGSDNGRNLQNSVFFFLTQGFGFRGSHESRQLEWGDVTVQTGEDGSEFLEFRERLSKTRQGDSFSGARPYAPKIFANDSEHCPVHYYRMFESHRPEKMKNPDSPFYLSVKPKVKGNDKVWYTSQPMGKNTIGKIVSSMAKNAGIEGKIVNHSLRKQTCQTLMSNFVPDTMICELTGHKNIGSLRNYTTANIKQQKAMSDILTKTLANEKCTSAGLDCPRPPKMICLPSTSGNDSKVAVPAQVDRAGGKKTETSLDKMMKASSGILSGANIHGTVNLNINFNMSSSQSVNVSPQTRPFLE